WKYVVTVMSDSPKALHYHEHADPGTHRHASIRAGACSGAVSRGRLCKVPAEGRVPDHGATYGRVGSNRRALRAAGAFRLSGDVVIACTMSDVIARVPTPRVPR